MQKEKNVFEGFTNLYELSKTLRFELKPVPKTKELLEENEVFKKDKIVDGNYHKIKYYFDILHREFVKESLKEAVLDYKEYYTELKSDQKSRNLPKIEEKLRKELVKYFDKKAEEWKWILAKQDVKFKQKGVEILFEKDNLEILKYIFQKKDGKIYFADILTGELKEIDDKNIPDIESKTISGKKENLFESFKGFQGYLTNFHQSRKNFYSEKDQTTAISNRAINENLRRFCDNLKQFEEKKREYAQAGLIEKEVNIFDFGFYNKCLIQEGIDSYNEKIGRKSNAEGEKGINQKINEFNQKNKDKKLRQFKSLYKQILSFREQRINAEIEKPEEVFSKILEFIALNEQKNKKSKELFFDFIEHQEKYKIDEIYFKGVALNTISGKWFSSWATIGEKIMIGKSDNKKFPDFVSFGELKKQFDAKNANLKYGVKAEDLFRIEYKEIYQNCPSHYETFLQIWGKEFVENLNGYDKKNSKGEKEHIAGYYDSLREVENMIIEDKVYTNKKEKRTGKNREGKTEEIEVEIQKEKIKNYADAALGIFQMMKYFALEKGKKKIEDKPQDQNFYNVFNEYYYGEEDYNLRFIQIYNGLRNYLTKKQFKTDKIKLNFENSTLLNGWDKNKESDNFGVILRKDGKYYLGLMKSKSNKIFDEIKNGEKMGEDIKKGFYEKMVYKFIKDATLSIPKATTQTKEVVSYFKNNTDAYNVFDKKTFNKPIKISKEIFELNNKIYLKSDLSKFIIRDKTSNEDEKRYIKTFQKEYLKLGGNLSVYKNSLKKWIDFCKDFLSSYKSCDFFDYASLKASEKYASVDEFYKDVNRLSYKTSFENVSEKYIYKKIENGELYLFEIYNKDFAEGHIGNKNLHTIYWENIFTKENEKNPVFKLNGQAEIFFRPKSINKKEIIITKENEIFLDKDSCKGKKAYKVNRYTEDKYLFHCPIKLNFACHNEKINDKVLKIISETDKIRLIGIDRGEKHLLYLSVIDLDGNIHQIKSLNVISSLGKKPPVDYHKLLDDREKGRDEARKSWQNIENIKELKAGYISQAVNEISKIIFDCFEKGEFPVIVFEDLNIGFKRGRFAIEKQVYQKFELAIAKKLNYLVSKSKGNQGEALQLTPPILNFKDLQNKNTDTMKKHSGIIFYIPASYTSKTCPVCGYRKNIGFAFNFENEKKSIETISRFKKFEYDNTEDCFNLEYNLSDYIMDNNGDSKKMQNKENQLYQSEKQKDKFIISSKSIIRHRWHDKQTERAKKLYRGEEFLKDTETKRGIVKKYNITECLKGIFDGKIDYNTDLHSKILSGDLKMDFYRDLFYVLGLMLDTRDSISGKEIDIIHCPECGFHSDKIDQFRNRKYTGKDPKDFVYNGDANGAYNIARKGILVIKKIKQFAEKEDIKNIKFEHFAINMEEWNKFSQSHQK